jgi:hypothetical protein
MPNRLIVMVSGLDDASHGELNILDSPEQAQSLIETLLESGFEQERIRVFTGDEMQMTVHHRPVVSLIGANGRGPDGRGGRKEDAPSGEEAPEPQQEQETEHATARSVAVGPEEVAAQPGVRNGVRFSTQFRPA